MIPYYSYTIMSYMLTVIAVIAESTLKVTSDIRCKFFGKGIFRTKSVRQMFLSLEHNL